MTRYDYELGVIGGGSAGLTIASGAARLGAKTLLIEKEKRLGGDCLYFGCVPSKTLSRTAQVYHLMKQAKTFGLPPVKVPPVAFKQVVQRIQSVIGTIQKQDSEERFCDLGVKVVHGQAEFLDPHTVSLNGKPVTAKNWVIATGSSPAIPSLPGLADTPYLTSRDLFSLTTLPQSMIILGAGPVAIEMAQAFSRLGTQVFVVQRGPQILSKEDKDMADQVMQDLEKEGVIFFLNTSIIRIEELDQERVAYLKIDPNQTKKMLSKIWPDEVVKIDRDRTLTLRAEALLVAMGRQSNLNGLGLETIGLSFDSKGLKLDKRLKTKHSHIYGAGDVTGEYQFTHAAAYEAGIVLSNALLQSPKKVDYTWIPWCTYSDPELAGLGLNEKRAKKKKIKYSIWTEEFKDNDRALALGVTSGKIKMLLDENDKPRGIQILGPGAGDLISEWVAATNGKVNLSTLAGAVHPYPTLGEINQTVARAVISRNLFSAKVKKGLQFFFQLRGRACGEGFED
jgi:pyruvate/2-oxoglutarate dehydrogenase complex dihydrolipoamide dehydrogenase (E3) component